MTKIMNELDLIMLVDDSSTDNFINERIIQMSGFCKDIITKTNAKNAFLLLLPS